MWADSLKQAFTTGCDLVRNGLMDDDQYRQLCQQIDGVRNDVIKPTTSNASNFYAGYSFLFQGSFTGKTTFAHVFTTQHPDVARYINLGSYGPREDTEAKSVLLTNYSTCERAAVAYYNLLLDRLFSSPPSHTTSPPSHASPPHPHATSHEDINTHLQCTVCFFFIDEIGLMLKAKIGDDDEPDAAFRVLRRVMRMFPTVLFIPIYTSSIVTRFAPPSKISPGDRSIGSFPWKVDKGPTFALPPSIVFTHSLGKPLSPTDPWYLFGRPGWKMLHENGAGLGRMIAFARRKVTEAVDWAPADEGDEMDVNYACFMALRFAVQVRACKLVVVAFCSGASS